MASGWKGLHAGSRANGQRIAKSPKLCAFAKYTSPKLCVISLDDMTSPAFLPKMSFRSNTTQL
jgi:hypothetical protein